MLTNIASTLSRQLYSVLISFAFVLVIARHFGPEGNGQYTIAMLLPTMLATFLNLGIAPATVYYVARGDLTLTKAIQLNIRLWIAFAILGTVLGVVLLAVFGGALFPGAPATSLTLSLFCFPLLLFQQLLGSLLQARQAFGLFNLTLLIPPSATLAAVYILVFLFPLGVIGALLSFIVGQLFGCVATWWAVSRLKRREPAMSKLEEYNHTSARDLLSFGWKAHASNILTFINYRADVFLINIYLSPASTGIYMVAVQLAERLWILSTAVSTVLLPRLSELHTNTELQHGLTAIVSKSVFAISLVASIILAIAATPLIQFLFGESFVSASRALLWLLPGIVLGSASRILSNYLAALGKPELNMYTAFLTASINVGANIVLIPSQGIIGAAQATTLAYIVDFFAKAILFARFTNLAWWQTILPTLNDLQTLIKMRRQ